jgi:hypothetical protein
MNILQRVSPWVLLAGLCAAASADEVVLKNGSKLEGAVKEDGNKITVDIGSGIITVDRSEVKSISKSDGLIEEYERRSKEMRPDDAEGHWQLYLWTRKHEGFQSRGERELQKILEIEPNHEGARRALGYMNYKGAWLTQDQYRAALGLVKYNGEWVNVETAERLRKIDEEVRVAQMKQDVEVERVKGELEIERQRANQRQEVLNMIESGQIPTPGVAPWGVRYWGPAVGANQPTVE